MMIVLSLLIALTLSVTASDGYREMTIMAVKKGQNPSEVIGEYFKQIHDDNHGIHALPPVSDSHHMCSQLLSSSSSHHLLSVDSMQDFLSSIDECIADADAMDFEVIKDHIESYNDSLFIMNLRTRTRRRLVVTNDDIQGTWVTHSSAFSQNEYGMASFVYNNVIYLLGGLASRAQQIIEVNTLTNTVTYDTNAPLAAAPCQGDSQFYTQIGENAYYAGSTKISRYDLSTGTLYANEIGPNIDINNTRDDLCLASSADTLYIIGGSYQSSSNALKTVHVYDISTTSWNRGPSMIKGRGSLTCIVHPTTNMLYAIGGSNVYNNFAYEPVIEKISIVDILNNAWAATAHNLINAMMDARSVIYQDYIVVIGGRCYNSGGGATDKCGSLSNEGAQMQLIDVNTDEVSLASAALSTNVNNHGAVFNADDNTIYVLGGNGIRDYSSLKLQTNPPTQAPTTANPTTTPTAPPSRYPTQTPTRAPSTDPTQSPTKYPTVYPTAGPTKTPTVNPTEETSAPSIPPTKYPSYSPTVETNAPTDNTLAPTMTPSQPPTDNTDAPSKAPTRTGETYPPTMSTGAPTDDTNTPTMTPSYAPTAATDAPSNPPTRTGETFAPSESPTGDTSEPSIAPSGSPTATGATNAPSTAPSAETPQGSHANAAGIIYSLVLSIVLSVFSF
eukprot:187993_1